MFVIDKAIASLRVLYVCQRWDNWSKDYDSEFCNRDNSARVDRDMIIVVGNCRIIRLICCLILLENVFMIIIDFDASTNVVRDN